MPNDPSSSFIVRIWLEPDEGGREEWRASVTDTATRERRYFPSPETLVDYLFSRASRHHEDAHRERIGERG